MAGMAGFRDLAGLAAIAGVKLGLAALLLAAAPVPAKVIAVSPGASDDETAPR